MKVDDVMTRGVITISPDDSVRRAAELMLRFDISGFPVLDRGKLVGIITQGDFLRRTETGTDRHRGRWTEIFADPGRLAEEYTHSHARKVSEVMTRDVLTVGADAPLEEAANLLERHNIRQLPVVNEAGLVGIISRTNLLHALIVAWPADKVTSSSDATIRKALEAALDKQAWAPIRSVQVTVDKGVVELQGIVRDDRQRKALRVVAENISGVKRVVDNLRELDLVSVS